METLKFVLLDIDYITKNSKPIVRLFGKLPDGRSIIAQDPTFKPYIYVLSYDINECIKELNRLKFFNYEKTLKKDINQEENFIKITFNHPREISALSRKLKTLKSVKEIREYDIPFSRRYLIDKALYPMSIVEAKVKTVRNSHKSTFEIQNDPKHITSSIPEFNVLSFKIEICSLRNQPNVDQDPISIISFYGKQNFQKIITTKNSNHNFVETVKNEGKLIERFLEVVKNENPDIILGYHSDNFDFPYLQNRASKLGIQLDLGVDRSKLKFVSGRRNVAMIKGRVHVDIYRVARRYLQLNHHSMKSVYENLYLENKVDMPAEEIHKCWIAEGEKLENLFKYALEDAKILSQIGEKMLPLLIELTQIVGQPLFEITRRGTGTQIKWYLIRKTYENGNILPNEPGKFERHVVGGYVEEPLKGLYENIYYFDFRSLYPSIIISKNISPESITENKDINCHIAPEFGYKFRKVPEGFIPSVVKELLEGRMKIKAEMKQCTDPEKYQMLDFRQDAWKRLSNTIYGLFNHPQFRWYSVECSEAITAWGKEYLQETMKKAEQEGFKVLYADTDGFYATDR